MTEQSADTRLLWTTAAFAAALAPHALHLQPWIVAFAAACGAWRLLAARRGWPLPGPWWRGAAALAATAGVVAGYRTITGLDGGTALLALMASLKLLETRAPRDHVVLIFIGWFLCLAAFFYWQSPATLAWVLPTAWLLAAALLVVARPAAAAGTTPFRTAGAMLAKAAPLALLLFLFFPRLGGQFWGAPSAERALTGLTEEMSPGEISDLTLNDQVAFRVRFEGAPPPPARRYWRGPVLTDFDGMTWSRTRVYDGRQPQLRHLGEPVRYTVTLEPSGQRMLFALDLPSAWPADVGELVWDYGLRARLPVNAVIQYEAASHLDYVAGDSLSQTSRRRHLQLPRERNPLTRAEAARLRAAVPDDQAYIEAVLARFRTEDFWYTLTPPGLDRDSVDEFLFRTRQGFCGHYASAFATLMRAAGIPARVVGGYQGGDWNPIGGYLILRHSHAHAWAEVWLEGRGWVRVDPTAAVAPERIERGLDAGGAAAAATGLEAAGDWGWQLRMRWDNVNAVWNDWVVRFDELQQIRLLEALGFEHPGWPELGLLLTAALAFSLAVVSAWLAWEFRPRRGDAAVASYRRFQRKLGRRGFERSPSEAPRDYLRRVLRHRPDLQRQATAITELYLRLRYAPAHGPADLRHLRLLVRRFRP